MASLVTASDQLVFGDFLASLHAERRKAERSRLHAGLDGGDASARGIGKASLQDYPIIAEYVPS